MIEIPLIDELRDIRRRLSEEQGCDPARYAAMLQQSSREVPGTYVDRPLLTDVEDQVHASADSAA